MGSTNLELAQSIFVSWERGDFSSHDWAHADIVWEVADGPEPSSRKGLARMASEWRDFVSLWQRYSIEAIEYHALDVERVLVLYERSGRGKTSGVDLEQLRARGASVFHFHDGQVTRLVSYSDPDRLPSATSLKQSPQSPGAPR